MKYFEISVKGWSLPLHWANNYSSNINRFSAIASDTRSFFFLRFDITHFGLWIYLVIYQCLTYLNRFFNSIHSYITFIYMNVWCLSIYTMIFNEIRFTNLYIWDRKQSDDDDPSDFKVNRPQCSDLSIVNLNINIFNIR